VLGLARIALEQTLLERRVGVVAEVEGDARVGGAAERLARRLGTANQLTGLERRGIARLLSCTTHGVDSSS
jgi:hypothetical protein